MILVTISGCCCHRHQHILSPTSDTKINVTLSLDFQLQILTDQLKLSFRNTQNTLGTNTGTNSQDIVWFAIRNVDKIDMGSKSIGTCINRAMVGVMESTDQDLTGCVGHARNVDW